MQDHKLMKAEIVVLIVILIKCVFNAGCALKIKKKGLKGEVIFSCGFSQLVCWVNSKTFIPNKGLKGFLVVCVCVLCVCLEPLT